MLHAVQQLADRYRPVTMAGERTLPVIDAISPLLAGGGLWRGATVVVTGSTAVLLALLAGPSAAGSWCAAIGLPWLGVRAAAELGIALERLALVPSPGRDWAAVAAAMLDGFDVVAVASPAHVRGSDGRRLAARARERGTVLVATGDGWPAADIVVRAGPAQWVGLGRGHGHLHARCLSVTVEGRGAAARPRRGALWLPDRDLVIRAASAQEAPPTTSPATFQAAPSATPFRPPPKAPARRRAQAATSALARLHAPDERATGPPHVAQGRADAALDVASA